MAPKTPIKPAVNKGGQQRRPLLFLPADFFGSGGNELCFSINANYDVTSRGLAERTKAESTCAGTARMPFVVRHGMWNWATDVTTILEMIKYM